MVENNLICKKHSGFESDIRTLEENVEKLWKKWDRITILLITTLAGVIVSIVINFVKA